MTQLSQEPILRRRSHAGILRWVDRLTQAVVTGGALSMAGLLLLLIVVVMMGAMPAIQKFGWSFFWNSKWSATKQNFGAWPLIVGTLKTSAIALFISLPISIGSALFLTKIAPKVRFQPWMIVALSNVFAVCTFFFIDEIISLLLFRLLQGGLWMALLLIVFAVPSYIAAYFLGRILLKHFVLVTSFLIELLAAIPSIAYGLWGIFVLVPFMQSTVQPAFGNTLGKLPWIGQFFDDSGMGGTGIFTAGLVLSIMITPIMTSIIRDVLLVAPPELEQGALGLGATWWQATKLVLGYSRTGIFGAVILGFGRAVGETMAVTMVIGNSNSSEASFFSQGYSIASKIANQFNNADTDGEIAALIYAAFVLLIMTTFINGLARLMVMRLALRAQRRK